MSTAAGCIVGTGCEALAAAIATTVTALHVYLICCSAQQSVEFAICKIGLCIMPWLNLHQYEDHPALHILRCCEQQKKELTMLISDPVYK